MNWEHYNSTTDENEWGNHTKNNNSNSCSDNSKNNICKTLKQINSNPKNIVYSKEFGFNVLRIKICNDFDNSTYFIHYYKTTNDVILYDEIKNNILNDVSKQMKFPNLSYFNKNAMIVISDKFENTIYIKNIHKPSQGIYYLELSFVLYIKI